MPGAGGQDGDVAGRDRDLFALVAAEPDDGVTPGDTERFMNRRVVVQIIVDAVPPHRAPAIGAEQALDGFFRMIVGDVDRALVDQERQLVVRHQAVVRENNGDRFDIVADDGHGSLRALALIGAGTNRHRRPKFAARF